MARGWGRSEEDLEAEKEQAREARQGSGRRPHERSSISIKLSALEPRYSLLQHARVMRRLVPKALELVRRAAASSIQLTIDVCTPCQAFWFDEHKDLQLSPGSTLQLMKYIGEHSSSLKPALSQALSCPRCRTTLTLAHNMTRNVRFVYWQCPNQHGHFITFFEFLKEKNFIRPLSPAEMQHLRASVQSVNCSNCGAAIELGAWIMTV